MELKVDCRTCAASLALLVMLVGATEFLCFSDRWIDVDFKQGDFIIGQASAGVKQLFCNADRSECRGEPWREDSVCYNYRTWYLVVAQLSSFTAIVQYIMILVHGIQGWPFNSWFTLSLFSFLGCVYCLMDVLALVFFYYDCAEAWASITHTAHYALASNHSTAVNIGFTIALVVQIASIASFAIFATWSWSAFRDRQRRVAPFVLSGQLP
jgi:hypothetical protein